MKVVYGLFAAFMNKIKLWNIKIPTLKMWFPNGFLNYNNKNIINKRRSKKVETE